MAPPIYATRCLRRFHKQRGSIRYHNLSAQWPVFLSDNAPCCTVTLLDKNSPSAPFSVSQPNTRGSFHCITCSHLQTVPGPIWSSVLVGLVDTETTAVYIAMQIICTTLCIHLLHVVSLRAALTIFTCFFWTRNTKYSTTAHQGHPGSSIFVCWLLATNCSIFPFIFLNPQCLRSSPPKKMELVCFRPIALQL
jgi:hypothetical protein